MGAGWRTTDGADSFLYEPERFMPWKRLWNGADEMKYKYIYIYRYSFLFELRTMFEVLDFQDSRQSKEGEMQSEMPSLSA